jgi:hypothetical protein
MLFKKVSDWNKPNGVVFPLVLYKNIMSLYYTMEAKYLLNKTH